VGRPKQIKLDTRFKTWKGDNIKMALKQIGCDYMYWINLAEVRVQWRIPVMNLPCP
jgi:hypothetical protein